MMLQGGDPRRNASSAEQRRGQKVQSDIKSHVPDNSTSENKHQEGTGQREAIKYLRESCNHSIKGFIANSLATLMRK